MTNLSNLYKKEIFLKLLEKFSYQNKHQVPKLQKIVINMGLGLSLQNKQILIKAVDELRAISGQQPVLTKAKKSIAGFKIREGMIIGLYVTLRREKMYSFFEKLCKLVLPRVRDFQGLDTKGFDKNGNYTLGISDQFLFPELQTDGTDARRGLDITIVTSSKTIKEAKALLEGLGFPFKKII